MKVYSPRFGTLLLVVLFLNLVGAQILHEAGHWAVLELYGRKPLWGISSMIQLWDREPRAPEAWVQFTDVEGDQGWAFRALGTRPIRLAWGLALFLGGVIVGPLIMLLNQWIIGQVDAGTIWGQGVFGFTLPVLLLAALSLLGLGLLKPKVSAAETMG